ncbi:MAG TPA: hypothetical protein VGB13_09940 [Candidatus Krumholzibacteria bacterium]
MRDGVPEAVGDLFEADVFVIEGLAQKSADAATQVYLPLVTLPGSVAALQPTRKHAV